MAGFLERRRLRASVGVIAAARRAWGEAPARSLLDVGGGTGLVTEQLGSGIQRLVVLEPGASARKKGARRRPFLEFVEGMAEAIPLPDSSFDRVAATGSFHHFTDAAAGLGEIRRVLAPGGRLVIFEHSPEKGHGRFLVRVACHKSLRQPEELRAMALDAGFSDVRVQDCPPGFLLVASK